MKSLIISLGLLLNATGAFAAYNSFCYINAGNENSCNNAPGCYYVPAQSVSICQGRPGIPAGQTDFCYVAGSAEACDRMPLCEYVASESPAQCLSK